MKTPASIETKMGVHCMFIYFPDNDIMLCATLPDFTLTIRPYEMNGHESVFEVDISDRILQLCQRLYIKPTTSDERELQEDYGRELYFLLDINLDKAVIMEEDGGMVIE